jgi:tetratricopeptide (TPR) repeat protein
MNALRRKFTVMEDEQVALEKIRFYMNDRKAKLAFKKLMEFMDKYPESPNIYLACAGLLIDCGTILRKTDLVKKGVWLIENSLQKNVDLLDEETQLTLQYNLSNGYGTQAELFQAMGEHKLSQEALNNQKTYLQKILLKKDKIDSDLLVNVINNYANCLDHLGRTVEAVDQYYDCLKIDPDHAVAMGNCSHALKRLFNISTQRNDKLLYESWRLLSQAVQLKDNVIDLAGVHLWDCYSNCLNNLESYISNFNPNGVKALENWIIENDQHHTS